MIIASFDIGKKNFAFCIERFDEKTLSSISCNPITSKRYNPDGSCTTEMENVLDQVCSNGDILLYKNLDLTKQSKVKGSSLDKKIFSNMTEVLKRYDEYWEDCSVFLIEQQMSFGKKLNLMAIKLAQHLYSYFSIFHPDKEIIEFPAYNKTKVLGAPKIKTGSKYKAMSKPQRKKWSVMRTTQILEDRGEEDMIKDMLWLNKQDDVSDTLLQLQAYKYMTFVDKN